MTDDRSIEVLVLFYPSQLWMAEQMGWERGKHYLVYKCLACGADMDRCICERREGKRK